jgi:hypothetical protein
MVSHIMELDASTLLNISNVRLCGMADPTTRYVMTLICRAVENVNKEFEGHLKPMCEHLHECPEFKPCGHWEVKCKKEQLVQQQTKSNESLWKTSPTHLCDHY